MSQISSKDLAAWSSALKSNGQLLDILYQREPTEKDGVDLAHAHLEHACMLARIGSFADRELAMREAALAAHGAARAAFEEDGEIQVAGPVRRKTFPAGYGRLGPGLWVHGWAMTLVARDDASRSVFENPALMKKAAKIGDGFWSSVLPALAAAGRGNPEALASLDLAILDTTTGHTRIVERGYTKHLVLPVLAIARQLVRGVAAELNRAITAALDLHRGWYGADKRYYDPSGLLPLPVLGLACLAADRGLAITVESDYLPRDLLAQPPAPSTGFSLGYIDPSWR